MKFLCGLCVCGLYFFFPLQGRFCKVFFPLLLFFSMMTSDMRAHPVKHKVKISPVSDFWLLSLLYKRLP